MADGRLIENVLTLRVSKGAIGRRVNESHIGPFTSREQMDSYYEDAKRKLSGLHMYAGFATKRWFPCDVSVENITFDCNSLKKKL
jgi:hypothetical protein